MGRRVIGSQTSRAAWTMLRLAVLPMTILGALAQNTHAAAAAAPASPIGGAASFDTDFFPTGMAPKMDISRFEKSGYVAPGTYRGDVLFNGEWRARTDIVFQSVPGQDDSLPCFDADALARYGVDWKKVRADTQRPALKAVPAGPFCGPLSDYIPDASSSFDPSTQELSLSVPQFYTRQAARGYVDPSQWDAGITAATLSYNANVYRSNHSGSGLTSGYLGINASLNVGSWHLTQLGSLNWASRGGTHYQNTATYLQHDIPSLQAQLAIGDTYTTGALFDSVRLRGVNLISDDRMLPQSMRGYAPVIHGVAETNAKVTIRQRGYIIYETSVAPGPFSINDLYPTGYGGDLNVDITEADGRIKSFSVPFSAVPQLLRAGQSQWNIVAGKIHQQNLKDEPNLIQATYQRGLNNRITGYTGVVIASGYVSALAGAALNTNIGAFSADVTLARNSLPGQPSTDGASFRLGYNKNIIETGTNFAVAAYRYSTPGFVGLSDAVVLRDAAARGYSNALTQRQRSRLDLSINQTLGDRYGYLYVAGSVRDFWNRSGRQVDFSGGYSNRWRSISYNLSVQRSRDSVQGFTMSNLSNRIPGAPDGYIVPVIPTRRDTSVFFSVSMPLGQTLRAPSFNAMYNHSEASGSSTMASLSGTAGADNRFAYGATMSHANGSNTYSLNGQYNGSKGNVAAGYSKGGGYQQWNAGLTGGMVVHAGGVTLSPSLGDTVGVVDAPDAAGASVSSAQGAVVDSRGYAVVPYLAPYELNTVALDPKGTAAGVELKETTQSVAPRAHSVVRLRYETSNGRAFMVETMLPDGRPVPFGADVFDEQGNKIGVAGQASRLVIGNMPESGVLTVRWSDDPTDSCRIAVNVPPLDKAHRGDLEWAQVACKGTSANTGQATSTTHPPNEPSVGGPSGIQADEQRALPASRESDRFSPSMKTSSGHATAGTQENSGRLYE
ncbi:fimbria/pilus outer membrane usher protein [Dyella silvae]|uniref:fimbria/pilus outer membrane usher protein n=1 Tax=Dyella silvae TaxID=2994424 RepID=UPI0022654213|nr:fimbria/pilus outer membrane usher protein [Dyella silvae]